MIRCIALSRVHAHAPLAYNFKCDPMIEFTKMQGLGNDFMVINALTDSPELSVLAIQRLANRRFGIGFDQLLILDPPTSSEADFSCRIINADGSHAEQCGNGMRCLARLILDDKLHPATEPIRLQTPGGLVVLQGQSNGDIRVNMGCPRFLPADIPANVGEAALSYTHKFGGRDVTFSLVNMGNPHAVIQVDGPCDDDFHKLGKAVGACALFPEGINVGFSQVVSSQNLILRVYERGSGETLACGSGACAAMAAGRRLGHLHESVRVDQPGGSLLIQWQGPGQPVWMTGKGEIVYRGVLQ